MEEPTYEYDWRHSIEVPNPNNKSGISVEDGSFKWFQYWLTGCTYQQIADEFNTSKTTVANIAKLFKWKERRKNKENYESWKREKLTEERYLEVLERAYVHKINEWDQQELLVTVAFIKLGIIENEENIPIPDEPIKFKDLAKVIQNEPKTTGQILDDIYRSLGKTPKINDKQDHNINAELDVSTRFKKIFNKERLNERYKD